MLTYQCKAENFLHNEKDFQLGFLSSEASNPITAHLDRDFNESSQKGVSTLLRVDQALVPVARRALADKRFAKLRTAIATALSNKKQIIFSGCGATGRLSILLEAAWRDYAKPEVKDSVKSIMTGGDFALVKSVEFFEDYPQFGKRQVEDMNVSSGDVLVGITATGETASIIGSVMAAAERNADVFLLICVDKDVPMNRLKRCKEAYSHPNVTVLDMPCAGMAVSGSTRMQSSTLEMLIAAAALEEAVGHGIADYAEAFKQMLNNLEKPENVKAIANYIDFETEIYQQKRLITYLSDEFLLDILTDTTERSPTFMLPPFKRIDKIDAPSSWAFVKTPCCPTPEAWRRCFRREPRCLAWTQEDYCAMDTAALVASEIPEISIMDLMKIEIGNEVALDRSDAVEVKISATRDEIKIQTADKLFQIASHVVPTSLRLFEHLALKLVLNIISTGAMVKLERVSGNWMTYLDVSNKKLIDRGIRIIASQCKMDYNDACHQLFKSIDELAKKDTGSEKISPVQYTISKFNSERQGEAKC